MYIYICIYKYIYNCAYAAKFISTVQRPCQRSMFPRAFALLQCDEERSETKEPLAPSCSTARNWLFTREQTISSPLKYAQKYHIHLTSMPASIELIRKEMSEHVTPRCPRAKWIRARSPPPLSHINT